MTTETTVATVSNPLPEHLRLRDGHPFRADRNGKHFVITGAPERILIIAGLIQPNEVRAVLDETPDLQIPVRRAALERLALITETPGPYIPKGSRGLYGAVGARHPAGELVAIFVGARKTVNRLRARACLSVCHRIPTSLLENRAFARAVWAMAEQITRRTDESGTALGEVLVDENAIPPAVRSWLVYGVTVGDIVRFAWFSAGDCAPLSYTGTVTLIEDYSNDHLMADVLVKGVLPDGGDRQFGVAAYKLTRVPGEGGRS